MSDFGDFDGSNESFGALVDDDFADCRTFDHGLDAFAALQPFGEEDVVDRAAPPDADLEDECQDSEWNSDPDDKIPLEVKQTGYRTLASVLPDLQGSHPHEDFMHLAADFVLSCPFCRRWEPLPSAPYVAPHIRFKVLGELHLQHFTRVQDALLAAAPPWMCQEEAVEDMHLSLPKCYGWECDVLAQLQDRLFKPVRKHRRRK